MGRRKWGLSRNSLVLACQPGLLTLLHRGEQLKAQSEVREPCSTRPEVPRNSQMLPVGHHVLSPLFQLNPEISFGKSDIHKVDALWP